MLTQNKILISFVFSCLLLFTFSCKQENTAQQIEYLNGYWEIEEVTLPDGETKSYSINMLVDFIELKDEKGFRKKVAPQLDGTFKITDDAEKIEVKTENNQVLLRYSTPFDEWTEIVVKADDNQLILKNETGTVYTYKRFEQLNLTQ